MSKLSKYFGPSTLVAAAFIGPGTITIATLAGAQHGYSLLWALIFSVIATIVLQEMAARLGIVTQEGLGEAIRKYQTHPILKVFFVFIAFFAIVIGNAAYEAGNISGAVLGLDLFNNKFNFYPLLIGGIAFCILFFGKYHLIEKFLLFLVLTMSISFLITAILVKPSFSELLSGLIPSKIDNRNLLLIIGLIGTTVVPYNLFLHASSVSEKHKSPMDLKTMRIENAIAIILGGFVTACVIITAASGFQNHGFPIDNASQMAVQLEPLFGASAKYFIGLGLFAAGISSAITAPLAAAYAANGLFGWQENIKGNKMKIVWISILLLGIIFSSLGLKPILIIKFAQVANGILLPIIAIYLIYLTSNADILGKYSNNKFQKVLGALVVLITLFISFKTLNSIFHFIS